MGPLTENPGSKKCTFAGRTYSVRYQYTSAPQKACVEKMHKDDIYDTIVSDEMILDFRKILLRKLGPRWKNDIGKAAGRTC
jgi:hypothetical protein